MTDRNPRRGDDLFDPLVAACLARAAEDVPVDVDVEWVRLVDRLAREAEELSTITDEGKASRPPGVDAQRVRSWSAGPLVAVAAVVLLLLAIAGPVFVRTTVTVVRFVEDVVEGEVPANVPEASTTVPRRLSPPTTFAPLPPPTPTPTSPPPTTVAPAPAPKPTPTPTSPPTTADLAHEKINDGDQYRFTLREVHDQLNAAIGFGRSNYAALDGADAKVESLLGRRTQYDARLRDLIGHLRQARDFSDRNAASAAHTLVEEIERELALASR